MGIRQLQRFITTCVPRGYVEVSIIDECENFSRKNNGKKPILVFDLMGLVAILNNDRVDMLYGRCHGKYFKIIENLFRRLSAIADLVFFEDGPVADFKYTTWLQRQNDRYERCIGVMDKIYEGVSIEDIASSPDYEVPSITSGLEFIETLAAKYGQIIVTVTKECDAELARFACNNPSVIAVLADDTDFLIFPGQWKYLSIKELNLDNLTTMEFSRTALRSYLGLNDKQLIVLSTIGGNDIIKYEEVQQCHGRAIGNDSRRGDVNAKFVAIANMIKHQVDLKDFHGMIYNLADFLLSDTSQTSRDRVFESFAQYNIKFNPVDHSDTSPMLDFCRQNSYNFVYGMLLRKPVNYAFSYYDLRQQDCPDFYDVLHRLDQRQIGIILQHQRPTPGEREIVLDTYAKISHDEPFMEHSLSPVYPEVTVPDLMELLDRENYPQHDEVRFKLMKWTISDLLADIDLTGIPVAYFRPMLTLYFMVQKGFISVIEADIILLTVKHVVLDVVPESFLYPPVVTARAFRIAFMYLKLYSDIGRSIKTAGLKTSSFHQNFEGAFFHKKFLDFAESGENPATFLTDLESYRIYRNLQD